MQRNKIIKYSLLYGSLTALSCLLFFIANYFINGNPLYLRRPDLGFNLLFIFLAIWFYKRSEGGYLHFYEGFSIGFLTNIIAALLVGVTLYLFIQFVDNKPFIKLIETSKAQMLSQKQVFLKAKTFTEESFDAQIKTFDNARPSQLILDELMFKQIAIVAIGIISMGLRKIKQL
jgi:hypothetical protein